MPLKDTQKKKHQTKCRTDKQKKTRHAHTRSQETLGCCPVLESSCLPVLVEQCFSPLLFLSSFAFWEESLHFLTTPLQTKSCIFFQWRSALPQLQSQFILQQGTSLYLSLPCRFRCCRTGDGCEASTASSASAKDLAFWKKMKTCYYVVTPCYSWIPLWKSMYFDGSTLWD